MTLLFQPEHIEQIREGEKTATRRDWSPNYNGAKVGNVYIAADEMFQSDGDADCYIRVTDRYREPLAEMDESDADAEGGYTLSEFREVWRDINGAWTPQLVVDVVEFEYVGRERPEPEAVV